MTDVRLSSDELTLARATKRAVQAAGGLEVCQRETGISDTQLSRCWSPNHRDSITIRDAVTVDAAGHGAVGHPHILHALARLAGGVFILLPEPHVDASGLQLTVLDLSAELGDVAAAVRDAIGGGSAGGADVTRAEAELVLAEIEGLDRVSARLRHQLRQIIEGAAPAG